MNHGEREKAAEMGHTKEPDALMHARWLSNSLTIGAAEAAAELRRLHEVENQRDELLAALSELTSTVGLAIDGATGWDAHKNARKLIARVKGGAA